MTVHHLLAVYSGGKLDLSGAGFQPNGDQKGPGAGVGVYMSCTSSCWYERRLLSVGFSYQ